MHPFAVLLASFSLFGHGAESVDFDSMQPGSVPKDWSMTITHKGEPGKWVVHPDLTAPSHPNVLAQLSADKNRARYAIALYDKAYLRNGDLAVDLKVVSGKFDQTAGLIWRYQDQNNYYFLHVSANEDSIGIFKMVEGRPSPVARLTPGLKAFEVSHRIDTQQWNTLRVTFKDTQMTVYFDHRKVMEVMDNTIVKPGKTGLWTKGDTTAYFDDFRIEKKKD